MRGERHTIRCFGSDNNQEKRDKEMRGDAGRGDAGQTSSVSERNCFTIEAERREWLFGAQFVG